MIAKLQHIMVLQTQNNLPLHMVHVWGIWAGSYYLAGRVWHYGYFLWHTCVYMYPYTMFL
jgi:hypothetical protein